MLLACIIGSVAVLLIWDYVHKRHRIGTLAKSEINGPANLPLVGTGLDAIKIGAESIIPYIGACFQKYGKTFRLWIMNELQVYTMDIGKFESILSNTTLLQKGDLYQLLRAFLNDGLLLSVGKKWHARRKVFTPVFHFKVLEHYVEVFDEQSGVLAQTLQPLADGHTAIDMLSKVSLAALDVIAETAMGVKVNAQLDPEFPYVKALKSVVYIQPSRMLKFSQRYDWMFKLTAPLVHRKLLQNIKIMRDFTNKVIEERRAEVERSMADGTYKPLSIADEDIGSKQQLALLDILLQSTIGGQALTNAEIQEEVDTFMFEGDDTTTSCISHALYSIGRAPEVQQKLFAEVLEVIGKDKHAPITMKHLSSLKYLECVIKETLRLYPPVPAIGRKTEQDIVIDGTVIPANTSIYMVIFWAHRDPANFPDPTSFKPDRFLESAEGNDKRNPFTYVPFSAGPKNCIGQKFALLEIKTMLSKLLRHYEILPLGPDVQPMMNFILRSTDGVCCGLRPRIY